MNKTFIGILILTLVLAFYLKEDSLLNSEEIKQVITQSVKESKRYDQPDKAVAWLEQFRQTQDKSKSPSQLNGDIKFKTETKESFKKSKNKTAGSTLPKFQFENLGPSNFGGRIRGFVIKSDDENQLLAGSVSGGIWKSTNAGQSWHAKGDFLSTIAIGSMIVDPDNSNRVYVGTGEGFFNSDAARGAGIFVSEDFGETWNQLASTNEIDFYYVNRLVRVPDSDVLIAATFSGIFRSEDLGQSWNEVSGFETAARGFVDMKMDPSDNNHILAVHYGNPNDALKLTIATPNNIANDYEAVLAGFGPAFPVNGMSGNMSIVEVDDGTGSSNDGCETITNNITGQIALIQRGSCNFTVKVKNAQIAGALSVIVYQNTGDSPITMGGADESITIPSAMISNADGDLIAAETSVTGNIQNVVSEILDRLLLQSLDAGVSWTPLDENNGLPESNVGRMELAFGSDGVIYVAVANSDDATLGLWRSPGGTANFNKTASNTAFIERQGWYDLAIGVHPTDSNTVFIGAVDQYVTRDGGTTISQNSIWSPGGTSVGGNAPTSISKYIHSDIHGFIFNPINPNQHYIVCDGGVFKTENNGESFASLNGGLSISQSYGIAVSPDGSKVTSGTQDNGSQIYFGDTNNWLEWHGGDGGFSAWDKQDANYLYGSTPNGGMFGSSTAGVSVEEITLPDTVGASFIQPFALDSNDGNRIIVGTDNVFYSANIRQLSGATFTDVTENIAGGTVSALSFNGNINNQILVGMTGGNIYKVDNVGTSNSLTDITPADNTNLVGGITDLKVDASDSSGNTLYATRGNYDVNRVLKSTNGGQSWFSITGDLPEMPVFQITIDPLDSNTIIIGTEMGLWATTLSGTTIEWVRYDYGLSFTRVLDFEWYGNDTLFIGTHGRGTYKALRNPIEISLNKFVTTNSSSDDDGILDNGESGLLMVNVQNNSGFSINNAQLNLVTASEIQIANPLINISNLPANSSTVIPVEVTLDSNVCSNEASIEASLSAESMNLQKTLSVLTSADNNVSHDNFIDGAESENTLMTTGLMLGSSAWQQVSSDANSGTNSWFTSDENNYADKSLFSPWLIFNGGGNVLDFALKYSTEGDASQYWDGVVLEIREKDGIWIDIGNLSSASYDGQLFTNNTAQARFAWAGNQNTWRNASVNLEEKYKGKTVQFRFRMINDTNTGGEGFWLDDISISNVIWNDEPTCDTNINTGHKLPGTGLWFDRSKNGHGFVIEPIGRDNLYFTVFYTYDDVGVPEWYTSLSTLENGVLNINFDADTLQRSIYDHDTLISSLDNSITDGRLSIDFNSDIVASQQACNDGTEGRPTNLLAIAKWKINDQQGSWCIEPLISEANKGFPDFGGTWYGGPDDSGWGFSLASFKSQLITVIYYYDASGEPRWSIGQQQDFKSSKLITTQMTEISGFGRLETPIETTVSNAGTVSLTLDNALNNLQIDGTADINAEFQGNQGGSWIRNSIPIQIFTKPH